MLVLVSMETDSALPPRFRYTFELFLSSEKLLLFGVESADDLHSWTKAIGKVPAVTMVTS